MKQWNDAFWEKCKTVFDPLYNSIVSYLVDVRHEKGMTQRDFAAKSDYKHSFVAKTELKDRRMDFIEIIRYMKHLGLSKKEIKTKVTEWLEEFVE